MKLVDILARELKAWPEGVRIITQQGGGYLFDEANYPLDILIDVSEDSFYAVVTRAEWQAAVDALNAPKFAEWDEFGFPPAGVTCEFTTNDGHNWKGCKILYADEVSILTGELEGKADRRLLRKCDADVKFRSARTAEQVAAEEREKDAQSLFELINPEGKWHKFAEEGKSRFRSAVDAGYRKQVAK